MAGTLVAALAPPTAGDALCYHLEIPKRFIEQGRIAYLPWTDNSLFPFLMEMLYTLGLLVSGPVLAQLLHWLMGVLFALASAELAAPLVGRARVRWVALIALAVPGVTNQMTAPLNDLALALFTTLVLVSWQHWAATRQRRWLVAMGITAGFALSVKLVALALVALVVPAIAIDAYRARGAAAACRCSLLLIALILFSGGVWYVRSWYYTGNPVYPYFNAAFGGEPHTKSLLRTPHAALAVPWMATMHPEEFGGRGVQFGALFLALVPGLVLLPRPRELTRLLAATLGFAGFWVVFRQDLRFLLPIVPVLASAAVFVWCELKQRHRAAWLVAGLCVAGLLSVQTLIVARRAKPCLAVAIGAESPEDYLARREPSFRVAQLVNTNVPAGSRLISQDYRGFYVRPAFVREDALRRRRPYKERGEALVRALSEWGFTHVLLVQAYNPETARYDQSFTARLGDAADRLRLVFAVHYEGPDGDRRDYRVLELPRLVPEQDGSPGSALNHRARRPLSS